MNCHHTNSTHRHNRSDQTTSWGQIRHDLATSVLAEYIMDVSAQYYQRHGNRVINTSQVDLIPGFHLGANCWGEKLSAWSGVGTWAYLAQLQGSGEMPPEKIYNYLLVLMSFHQFINYFDLYLFGGSFDVWRGSSTPPPQSMKPWVLTGSVTSWFRDRSSFVPRVTCACKLKDKSYFTTETRIRW